MRSTPRRRLPIAKGGDVPGEAEVDDINLVPDEYRGLDRFEARKRVVDAINAEGLAVTVDGRRRQRRAAGRDQEDHAALRRPLRRRHRADADRPVVRRRRRRWPSRRSPRCARAAPSSCPKNWEKTYFDWMENIQPWCISRQLWWGHQIPAWYGPDGHVFVEKTREGGAGRRRRALSGATKARGRPGSRSSSRISRPARS